MTSVTKPKMYVQLDHRNLQKLVLLYWNCRTNSLRLALCMQVLQVSRIACIYLVERFGSVNSSGVGKPVQMLYILTIYFFSLGASEPRNMAYMNRLGIWGLKTPFREFNNFIQAVERRYISSSLFLYVKKQKQNSLPCHGLECWWLQNVLTCRVGCNALL